jgi:hypothetical protein
MKRLPGRLGVRQRVVIDKGGEMSLQGWLHDAAVHGEVGEV